MPPSGSRAARSTREAAAVPDPPAHASGFLLWSTTAAAGLSAVLPASPTAYAVLRIAGGIVLMIIGVKTLRIALTTVSDRPPGEGGRSTGTETANTPALGLPNWAPRWQQVSEGQAGPDRPRAAAALCTGSHEVARYGRWRRSTPQRSPRLRRPLRPGATRVLCPTARERGSR
ncbi:LysE family translocator [Streptomyces shenzhenensis]|uniref:LysE family translocator n=1 Tax=Streptomyces shenzhenensis TaxID=943815 RepID=UPI00217D9427|nr:LysE family transporter [Streptomyces shenzhenensis]